MSQHPSLRSGSTLKVKKSVLKRYDRIEIMKKKGKWDEEKSIYGLPKTKIEE